MLPFEKSPSKDMSGLECAMPVTERGVNCRFNFIGIGIFQIQNRKSKLYIESKKDLLHIINRL